MTESQLKKAQNAEKSYWKSYFVVTGVFYILFMGLIVYYGVYERMEKQEEGSYEGIHFETQGVDMVCRKNQNTYD